MSKKKEIPTAEVTAIISGSIHTAYSKYWQKSRRVYTLRDGTQTKIRYSCICRDAGNTESLANMIKRLGAQLVIEVEGESEKTRTGFARYAHSGKRKGSKRTDCIQRYWYPEGRSISPKAALNMVELSLKQSGPVHSKKWLGLTT
jgi:hypothetical protein